MDLKSTGCSSACCDLRFEGLDDRLRGALVAGMQVARADHGLDHGRQHALGLAERERVLAHVLRRGGVQPLGHREPLRDRAAGRPGDRLRTNLRQAPGTEALGLQARIEMRRDGEREHAVPEEREARVGVAAPLAPRSVREDLTRELLRGAPPTARTAASWDCITLARGRAVSDHEVDGLPDGEDVGGLLVGDAHAVAVLELLHERVQVERVRREVLLEARLERDLSRDPRLARRRDGRGSARTPAQESSPRRLASWADDDARAAAARRAPRTLERGVGRADDVLARTALGAQDRLREAAAGEAPVRHDPEPAQAEQVRAALPLGVDLVAKRAQRGPQQQSAELCARGVDSAAARIDWRIVCETPSMSFSAMLPVKPSVTTTSAAPLVTSPPSTLPRNSNAGPRSSRARARGGASAESRRPRRVARATARRPPSTSGAAARVLLAVGEQRDARPRDPEHGAARGRRP